jgi:hypothetical protein
LGSKVWSGVDRFCFGGDWVLKPERSVETEKNRRKLIVAGILSVKDLRTGAE